MSRGREDPYAIPRNHQYAKPHTSGISAHLEDSTYVGSSKNNANHYSSTSKEQTTYIFFSQCIVFFEKVMYNFIKKNV